MTKYKRIKLTIIALQYCYPQQKIYRKEILNALNSMYFQSIYVD